jgi:excisionase family DNA binding protein
MSGLSLREAAQQASVSKSTILRAVRTGRLSAARTDDGGYSIEPSELFRVYEPRRSSNGASAGTQQATATGELKAQLEGARRVEELLRRQLDDIREDRDRWRAQAEAIIRQLADQRTRRPWWRAFG